jgi:hypothetical protein
MGLRRWFGAFVFTSSKDCLKTPLRLSGKLQLCDLSSRRKGSAGPLRQVDQGRRAAVGYQRGDEDFGCCLSGGDGHGIRHGCTPSAAHSPRPTRLARLRTSVLHLAPASVPSLAPSPRPQERPHHSIREAGRVATATSRFAGSRSLWTSVLAAAAFGMIPAAADASTGFIADASYNEPPPDGVDVKHDRRRDRLR